MVTWVMSSRTTGYRTASLTPSGNIPTRNRNRWDLLGGEGRGGEGRGGDITSHTAVSYKGNKQFRSKIDLLHVFYLLHYSKNLPIVLNNILMPVFTVFVWLQAIRLKKKGVIISY